MNSRGLGTTFVCGIGLFLLLPASHREVAQAGGFDRAPPPPLPGAAACFDAARQRWIAFGGRGASGLTDALFVWDGVAGGWQTVAVDPQSPLPPARAWAGVTACAAGMLMLFGGEDDSTFARDDTWVFDFVAHWWWQFTPKPGDQNPDPRVRAELSYNATTGAVTLRGGEAYRGGPPLDDCWRFDREREHWTKVW